MSARNMWGVGCWANYAQRTTQTNAKSGRQGVPPTVLRDRLKRRLTANWRTRNLRSEK